MENSQTPKPDDVLKPQDSETDESASSVAGHVPRLHEGLLGIEAFHDKTDDQPEPVLSPNEKKRKKAKKKDSVLGRFLPQPDLLDNEGDDSVEKRSWATKVADLLSSTSTNDDLSSGGQDELPSADPSAFESTEQNNTYEEWVDRPIEPRTVAQDTPGEQPVSAAEDSPENSAEQPSEPPAANLATGGGEGGGLPPEEPPARVESTPPEPRPESVQSILARHSTENIAAGPVPSEANTVHITNNYYQRRSNIGALLAVDQMSRHRDRKLRRHNRTQDKTASKMGRQIDNLSAQAALAQKNNNEQKLSSVDLETRQAAEKKSNVPEKKGSMKLTGAVVERPEMIPVPSEARKRLFTSELKPEKTVQNSEYRNVPVLLSAEKVQKTVEVAAEAAVPIESLYERRHEMKGNDDFAAAAEVAIRKRSSIYNNEIQQLETQNIEQQINTQPTKAADTPQPKLYTQAAKGGVIAAFAFIIAFLIIYLLLMQS